MARPAPSVERTVTLLKFLADHPRERFTLSDLARRLEFNKATCHAMLTELLNQGMLIRHPSDKAYMLGPVLVNLGTAAAIDSNEALEIARGEMIAIRDELDVSCVASILIGADSVVIARADVNRPIFGFVPIGAHTPATPPTGAEFYAWAREDEVEAWLDRHERKLSVEARNAYYEGLNRIRIAGYQVALVEHVKTLRSLLEQISDLPGASELAQSLDKLDENDSIAQTMGADQDFDNMSPVLTVKAPIFGPSGRILMSLAVSQISGFDRRLARKCADRLLEGTRRVTAALHGNEPFPQWARPVSSGGRLPDGS